MPNIEQTGRRAKLMVSGALLAGAIMGGGAMVLSSAFAGSTPDRKSVV